MRSDRVVLIAPLLDDDLRFLQAEEDLLVEAFVPQFSVEGLAIAVLPWAAGLDVEGSGAEPGEPTADHLGGHLRAIVGTNVLGDSPGDHHVRHRLDDAEAVDAASDPDRQALAGVLVDQRHQPDATTVMGLSLDEVVTPDMIAMLWPQPDTGSIIEP